MATVLAGPRIGEHVACQRGQSKCVVKFAIAQLITNKPVTLTGYLRFRVAAGLFRSNVEHAKRLWFTRDHLAMAQALGWDRVGIGEAWRQFQRCALGGTVPKPCGAAARARSKKPPPGLRSATASRKVGRDTQARRNCRRFS